MNQETAQHVLPATEGQIDVTSVSAGAATAAIVIANLPSQRYVRIQVDDGAGGESGAYLTRKHNGVPTDPNPTSTSGADQTQWYDPLGLSALVFVPGDQIKLFVPGAGTFYVRQSLASPA